jgi:hypothetical protein
MMLGAGITSLALAPAAAQEKKVEKKAAKPASMEDDAATKCLPPGEKGKAREKVAAGTAQQGGEVNPAECKATPAGKSDKTRAQVKQETKAAAKKGEIKYGETEGRK